MERDPTNCCRVDLLRGGHFDLVCGNLDLHRSLKEVDVDQETAAGQEV